MRYPVDIVYIHAINSGKDTTPVNITKKGA